MEEELGINKEGAALGNLAEIIRGEEVEWRWGDR